MAENSENILDRVQALEAKVESQSEIIQALVEKVNHQKKKFECQIDNCGRRFGYPHTLRRHQAK